MDAKTLDSLLKTGVAHGVSDVHFRPGAPPLFRINGAMTAVKYERLLPSHTQAVAEHFLATMGDRQAARKMMQTGFSGYYLAVDVPGRIAAGQSFELRPGPRAMKLSALSR